MPYPNFHAARVRRPTDFMKDSIRNITLKGVEGIQLLSGKLKKDGASGPMTAQAYRFDKDKFTAAEARKWMKDHKLHVILFEPASEKKGVTEMATVSTAANIGVRESRPLGIIRFDAAWENAFKPKKKKKPEEQMAEQDKVIATAEGTDSIYGSGFKGGDHWRENIVRKALQASRKYGDYPSIVEIFDDRVYIETYDSMLSKQRCFEVEYDLDEEAETATIGDATEVVKKTDWILKEQAEKLARNLFPITEEAEVIEEAQWTAAFIDNLPDSSFAVISAGGKKDDEGKTVPRSLRHLPYKDADGKVDKPHLRNALARISQADLTAEEKKSGQAKLDKAAKGAKVGLE